MTGVITFLCCSDTRRYVTAAGSICPVAPACSQWQMLFARNNAGETKKEKLNNEMRFRDCERVQGSSRALSRSSRRNYRSQTTRLSFETPERKQPRNIDFQSCMNSICTDTRCEQYQFLCGRRNVPSIAPFCHKTGKNSSARFAFVSAPSTRRVFLQTSHTVSEES